MRPACLPEVVRRVIEETGCGLLLDLSHTRLAAQELGMDARDYISALPVERIHEIHVTGIQRFEGRWMDMVRRAGIKEEEVVFAGQPIDHTGNGSDIPGGDNPASAVRNRGQPHHLSGDAAC